MIPVLTAVLAAVALDGATRVPDVYAPGDQTTFVLEAAGERIGEHWWSYAGEVDLLGRKAHRFEGALRLTQTLPLGKLEVRSRGELWTDELGHPIRFLARSEAGGIAVFLGTVRDQNGGQPVSLLEYEAYRSMAEKEMALLGAELEAEIAGVRVACQHRTGSLQVGDIAVVCAASAPHRDEAFRACRELIDRVKARVPIWKREHGPAGPYWVGFEHSSSKPGEGE